VCNGKPYKPIFVHDFHHQWIVRVAGMMVALMSLRRDPSGHH